MVQEFDKNSKVIRTFRRSMRNAQQIIKAFPRQFVILETPKDSRTPEAPKQPTMTASEMIEMIEKSESIEAIQELTQDPRKSVRDAASKRLVVLFDKQN